MTDAKEIIPTTEQEAAMALIAEFLAKPHTDPTDLNERLFAISGAAGTGKTTLLGMIRDRVEHCVVSAPTNKAVGGLRKKGFDKATTVDKVINKKIYTPYERPLTSLEIDYHETNGLPVPKFFIVDEWEIIDNAEAGLAVVVDEASMTDTVMLSKLLLLYKKIIMVGDGFQLPPVDAEAWFQDWNYNITLTIPVRAAASSEITQLANMVRVKDSKWAKHGWNKEVTIIPRGHAMALTAVRDADLVIAATNITCNKWNGIIRDERGLAVDDGAKPVKGDWLLAWDKYSKERIEKSERYEVIAATAGMGCYHVRLLHENGEWVVVTGNKAKLLDQKSTARSDGMMQFSFGHCITCHKTQGGEWDNVVVLAFDKTRSHSDYWNWLYTAVSRAKKHLTILT